MPVRSPLSSWWRSVRQLPGRTPLRVKLVAALLALVAVALAVISVSSLAVFGNYLQDRADSQLQYLYAEARDSTTLIGGHNPVFTLPGYVAELRDSQGKLLPWGSAHRLTIPGPQVPAGRAWLKANSGKLTTVPAVSGNDNWRIITGPQAYHACNPFTEQCGATRTGTLVVGVDLGNINQTIGWLARIDLLVSLIIMAALAVAGVAAVRASLRPLTDIEQTARDIAAGDLTRRVPDRDPRTEVGRLGRSLNTMLSQIEAAFHARARSEAAARQSEERMRQFIADASHELRTPLTAIRGYAEYYRQRGGAENGAAARLRELPDGAQGPASQPGQPPAGDDLADAGLDRIMDRVEQESARMGALVEELLLLARLDQQRPIEHRLVDLLTLAADAVQDARMIAPDRSVDLEVGSGPAFLVLGDEARLRQVISNLMSNALMHAPGGTPIHVRLRPGLLAPAPGTDGPGTDGPGTDGPGTDGPGTDGPGTPPLPRPAAVLEVADEGPGMTGEQARRVFERFYRADQARTRKRGGTGLGLAIVAALVAAHDGMVSVETSPGRGATFLVTLPLAPEAQGGPSSARSEAGTEAPLQARNQGSAL